jgi:hypothetical protein
MLNTTAPGAVRPRRHRTGASTWYRACGHDLCAWGSPSDPEYCAEKLPVYECEHPDCWTTSGSEVLRDGAWHYRCAIDGTVYFVLRDGLIKIGWTRNLYKRLWALGRGSSFIPGLTVGPVEILHTMPGSRWAETDWHHTFAEQRVAGEWFRYEGRLAWFLGPYVKNSTLARSSHD